MVHKSFKKREKRAVSLLAAASVAASQLLSTVSVDAASISPTYGIIPQNTFWWGDNTADEATEKETEIRYGDVDNNG